MVKNAFVCEQRKLGDALFRSGEKNASGLPYESYSVSNKDGFLNQRDQFKNGGIVTVADKSKSIMLGFIAVSHLRESDERSKRQNAF